MLEPLTVADWKHVQVLAMSPAGALLTSHVYGDFADHAEAHAFAQATFADGTRYCVRTVYAAQNVDVEASPVNRAKFARVTAANARAARAADERMAAAQRAAGLPVTVRGKA